MTHFSEFQDSFKSEVYNFIEQTFGIKSTKAHWNASELGELTREDREILLPIFARDYEI